MALFGPFNGLFGVIFLGGQNGIFRALKCTFWNFRISVSVWGLDDRNAKEKLQAFSSIFRALMRKEPTVHGVFDALMVKKKPRFRGLDAHLSALMMRAPRVSIAYSPLIAIGPSRIPQ